MREPGQSFCCANEIRAEVSPPRELETEHRGGGEKAFSQNRGEKKTLLDIIVRSVLCLATEKFPADS